jgi:hypothetical protein
VWLATPANYGGELCQHLAGPPLDELVSQQVLTALEPAALELSLEAARHLEQERTDLDRLWQQRLERAVFETERAGRHYHLVEPENRLVARQLALCVGREIVGAAEVARGQKRASAISNPVSFQPTSRRRFVN